MSSRAQYDVVVVGAGIAGCAAAALYGRRGARVALIERHADPASYKTVCTTFIQASATPVLEPLRMVPRLEKAGAIRNAIDIWTRWGWIRPQLDERYRGLQYGYNVRRETLGPMLRGLAAATPGVELMAGASPTALVRDGERVTGLIVRGRTTADRELRARLVVGADGRGSALAELAGVDARTRPHGRIAYFGHYRDVGLAAGTHSQMWLSSRTSPTSSRTTTASRSWRPCPHATSSPPSTPTRRQASSASSSASRTDRRSRGRTASPR